jgi:hypothetical protein
MEVEEEDIILELITVVWVAAVVVWMAQFLVMA